MFSETSMNRRGFIAASSIVGAMGMAGTASIEAIASGGPAIDPAAIRPFRIHVPEAALTDLRHRILATRWPDRETVGDTSQGLKLATMQKAARYWASAYDWRRTEAYLNDLPNFVTEIDGVDIHFIHVKSNHPGALPIIVTHGWPGSIIEQLKIIGPLTDPTAHGGTAADAFDVVIPSLPGHGFSGKPTELGWDPIRIARAWAVLMRRLGYTRYVAQGGDWGNAVTEQLALLEPAGLIGIHTNMPASVPDDIAVALAAGGTAPAGLSSDEKRAYDQLDSFYKNGLGYATEMAKRPQTLYALADSPIGLAAWMFDHDVRSMELITRVFDGAEEGLSKRDLIDNVTLYWLTNTAVSSARLYWESKLAFFAPKGIRLPAAISAYPDEIYQAPRRWGGEGLSKADPLQSAPEGRPFRCLGAACLFRERDARRVQVTPLTPSGAGRRASLPSPMRAAHPCYLTAIKGYPMSFIKFALLASSLMLTAPTAPPPAPKPTIVLVHGAFADSNSWNGVAAELSHDGYPVVSAANPLRGASSDAAYVSSLVESINGPVVLVGHSYGGTVITQAADGRPNVQALVYVSAFAPEIGESSFELAGKFPGSVLNTVLAPPVTTPDGKQDLYIRDDQFPAAFAADLPVAAARIAAFAQRPLTLQAGEEKVRVAAWKSILSWFIYGSKDLAIPPAAIRFMADRAEARKTVVVPGASHVVMISHPHEVAALIEEAASAPVR